MPRWSGPALLATAILGTSNLVFGELGPRFAQHCNRPVFNVTGAAEFSKQLNNGEAARDWESDEVGRCWCFDARPMATLNLWGTTRIIRVRPYNPTQTHVWHASDQDGVLKAMSQDNGGLFAWVSRFGMAHAHTCSMLSSRGECLIRTSAFQPVCVAVRGSSRGSSLRIANEFDRETLLPLLFAVLIFLLAPSISHNLYCYYLSGALFTALFCVIVAAFFTLRKFLGPKQAVFFGALSYGGILWQTTLHNLLHHRMIVLALVCAAFAGFLLAYNYPPSKKGQMSFQMILQFVAGILVFIASPSLASEGCAIYLVFGTSWIYTSYVRPHLRPRRLGREDGRNSEEHDVAAQGGETMGFESPQGTDRGPTDAAAAGYVRHVAERTESDRVGYTDAKEAPDGETVFAPARGGAPVAMRTDDGANPRAGRYIEEHYRGPLETEVKTHNPFHCAGAQEYVSEEAYRRQAIEHTRRQEEELTAYMMTGGGFEKYTHLLSAEAKRMWAEKVGESQLPPDRNASDSD